LRKRYQ